MPVINTKLASQNEKAKVTDNSSTAPTSIKSGTFGGVVSRQLLTLQWHTIPPHHFVVVYNKSPLCRLVLIKASSLESWI